MFQSKYTIFRAASNLLGAAIASTFLAFVFTGGSFSLSPANAQQPVPTIAAGTAPSPSATTAKDVWLGMYMSGERIGYSHIHTEPATYKGRPALKLTSKGVTKLKLFGAQVEQDEETETLADLQQRPLRQIMDIRSNGSVLHLEAVYDYVKHTVACVSGTDRDRTTKTLAMPKDIPLAADSSLMVEGKKLAVGQKFTFAYLYPLTVEFQTAEVAVTGRETVHSAITGKDISAFLVSSKMPVGDSVEWDDENGDTLKSETHVGGITISMIAQPKEVALGSIPADKKASSTFSSGTKPAYVPPADFAIATAVVSDRRIADPRHLRSMHVIVSGIPGSQFVLSDARQKASAVMTEPGASATATGAGSVSETSGISVRLDIHADAIDPSHSVRLPITDTACASYLSKAAFLDIDSPGIRAMAKKLRGGDSNAARVVLKLRDWVSANMTPDMTIGVPRTATNIFGRRRGVCRDYATLYTALARAAGIPTRLCSGIVYADGVGGSSAPGRFFYHAWAESYVGKWIAVDPTLNNPADPLPYVDATHIKFAQGDVARMYDVVGVIGKLHIRSD